VLLRPSDDDLQVSALRQWGSPFLPWILAADGDS